MKRPVVARVLPRTLGIAAVLFAAVQAPSESHAQASKPPVVSLKPFIQTGVWQLDITWTAKDAYEDEDWSATLELTATARFILRQTDRRDDWGHWHAEALQSGNLVLSGVLVHKSDHSRTEYRQDPSRKPEGGVLFDVGGATPGYQLTVNVAYPAKLTNPLLGTVDTVVNLQTTNILDSPPVFCTGPLPASGKAIHGSLVIPWETAPFVSPFPRAKVAIQYVLQPLTDLAPLVPPKR